MANPHRGEAPLELGGKQYVLRIDFNAVADIQDATGIDLENLAEELDRKSLPFLRAALAAGLSREHKRVSVWQAGRLIGANMDRLGDIGQAIATALIRYFQGAKPAEATSDDSPLPPTPPLSPPAAEAALGAVRTA
jgi:predicted transcriptional regulator